MEIIKLQNKSLKVENSLDGLNSRVGMTGEMQPTCARINRIYPNRTKRENGIANKVNSGTGTRRQ